VNSQSAQTCVFSAHCSDHHENSQAPPGAAGQRLDGRVFLKGCVPRERGTENCSIRGHPFPAPRGRGARHTHCVLSSRRCPACAGLRLATFVGKGWLVPVDGGMSEAADRAAKILLEIGRKSGVTDLSSIRPRRLNRNPPSPIPSPPSSHRSLFTVYRSPKKTPRPCGRGCSDRTFRSRSTRWPCRCSSAWTSRRCCSRTP